jgi:hypothetical protein
MWILIKAFLSKHLSAVIVAILAVIVFFVLDFEINAKAKEIQNLKISNQNLLAENDSITVTKNKEGQVQYDKYALVAKQYSDLKSINSDLEQKIKDQTGNVIGAVSSGTKLVDSGVFKPTVVKDSITKQAGVVTYIQKDVNFSLDTTYSKGNSHKLVTKIHIQGVPDSLQITGVLARDEIAFTALTGVKIDKEGNYVIFVVPDYPGAVITQLNGAIIDKHIFQKPDKKRIFTLGGSFGYIPILYNWSTKQTILFGPNLGASLGVNVNLTELLRKK